MDNVAVLIMYILCVALTFFMWMLYDRCWNPNLYIKPWVRVVTSLIFPVGMFITGTMFIIVGIGNMFAGFTFWYLRSVGKLYKP